METGKDGYIQCKVTSHLLKFTKVLPVHEVWNYFYKQSGNHGMATIPEVEQWYKDRGFILEGFV